MPAWHVSLTVPALPSLHARPSPAATHRPVAGTHTWHGFPAHGLLLRHGLSVPMHVPCRHWSWMVLLSWSSHATPSATLVALHRPSASTHVLTWHVMFRQTTPSHGRTAVPTHVPATQTSLKVPGFWSSQEVPLARAVGAEHVPLEPHDPGTRHGFSVVHVTLVHGSGTHAPGLPTKPRWQTHAATPPAWSWHTVLAWLQTVRRQSPPTVTFSMAMNSP